MKQEFEMTQEEMDDIIQINKDVGPVMQIGTVTTGMDRQEKINNYWQGLADKYGFNPETVEGSSRGELYFLAEPALTKDQRAEAELKKDLEHGIELSTKLIKYVIDMGAMATKIPVTYKGNIWNVKVECITDSVKEEICPLCESPLEDNGKCSDVGSNNCQYKK
ncbi:hypothetical protein LCGC14_1114590 [marine sediment metagenome]|uniref:Uncharacterized protein n=1 Tax=marine sediment metagenome TaxID=412755 RepID=A0A0F9QBQ4_9ZZZZ|nr:hypothetical protein [Candidatus Aminicenantes bacterium]